MSHPSTYQILNRLLTILYRSLPMYLTYATPRRHQGEEQALKTLKLIAADQEQISQRIGQYIIEHHGPIEIGEYPIEFLDLHDLSLDFLVGRLIDYQKRDISAMEACVALLKHERGAAALAEEALGGARGHLESLEELAAQFAKSAT
jgi:hypothetical protein